MVVEDVGITVLVHAHEEDAEVVEARGEGAEADGHVVGVFLARGGHGGDHEGDDGAAAGFDGDGGEVEPGLVEGTGEGQEGGEVLQVLNGLAIEERLEVPEDHGSVCSHGGDIEVLGHCQERDGDRWRDSLRVLVGLSINS